MIAVVDVETIEVPGDYIEFALPEHAPEIPFHGYGEIAEKSVMKEGIKATEFWLPSGERVFIGWSKKVQKEIGLPFKVFQDQADEIKRLNRKVHNTFSKLIETENELRRFTGMSFWEKVKLCFSHYLF